MRNYGGYRWLNIGEVASACAPDLKPHVNVCGLRSSFSSASIQLPQSAG
jgi:hypothetical protein